MNGTIQISPTLGGGRGLRTNGSRQVAAKFGRAQRICFCLPASHRTRPRLKTFFNDGDFQATASFLGEHCRAHAVAVWAYCLMPNHEHLILAPQSGRGLANALSETHRRYSRATSGRTGAGFFLGQGRFVSFPMDGNHVLAAAQYVELNPGRAKLVSTPEAI